MKKVKSVLLIFIGIIMCFSAFTFTACGEDDFDVDASAPVYSNGGTVVEYDGYVYFINGIPDYTDDSGTTNREGEVVKGGLYRAKLVPDHGTVAEEEAKEENLVNGEIDTNADNLGAVLNFAYEKWDYIKLGEYSIGKSAEDDDALVMGDDGELHQNIVPINGERSEYRISVEPVIQKKIGTSGYDKGGFWIYDGYVFFASPATSRNSSGDVEYEKAEFFCYNLADGSLTSIRKSTEVNAALPYSFYKYGDSVYLVTYESYYANSDDEKKDIKTDYILSTKITNGSVGKTEEIVSGASSVFFTERETYDPEAKTNTAEDYIYYTRQSDTDGYTTGSTTLEMIAPDGTTVGDLTANEDGTEQSLPVIAMSSGTSLAIEGVAGGYLYYRIPDNNGNTRLDFTNLYSFLKIYDGEAPVQNTYSGTLVSNVSDYTSYLPIAGEGGAYVVATASDGVYNLGAVDGVAQEREILAEGSITVLGVHDGIVYGTISSILNAFNAFVRPTDIRNTLTPLGVDSSLNVGPFKLDFFDVYKASGDTAVKTDSYLAYFGQYHAAAVDHMLIVQTNIKYSDGQEIRGVSIPLGQETDSEHRVVTCYDDTCLNWLHDHSSWDTTQSIEGEGEEEESDE